MHRKDLLLTYLFPRSPDTVFLMSLVSAESVAWTWAQLHSWACSSAITDSVGVFSSDITSVATFSGFRALASSSAQARSASVKVHNSLAFFRTSVESNAAQMEVCCSKKRSNISQGLFHLVATSVMSLCSGRLSSFCFSFRAWLAIVLFLKKAMMLYWKN